MLFPLLTLTLLAISVLQQGLSQDLNNLGVCVNPESSYLLVEWEPPFPKDAHMLDVQCSSLNDSFSRSFTVQLSPELDTTIAVRVPVHGTGVHLGYVYVIEATLHTTNGRILRSDPIIAVASYFQDIYWQFKSSTSITFRCTLSNSCSRVIGGCMVSLSKQGGQDTNLTIPVVGRNNIVEGTFDDLDLSITYSYTASAVRRDLTTPLGRAISGAIPPIMFDTTTFSTTSTVFSTTSTVFSTTSRTSSKSISPTRSVSSTVVHMFSSTVKLSTSEPKVSTIVLTSSRTMTSSTVTPSVTSVSRGPMTSPSKEFPMIAIIGIVCGVILLLAGIFAFVLTILGKTRHYSQRRSSNAAPSKQHRSMFWPFNVDSSKRNGHLHPSIVVDSTVSPNTGTNGTTNTAGYVKMSSPFLQTVSNESKPADYEIPIKSPPAVEDAKATAKPPDEFVTATIYEMPSIPDQTAYLTQDFDQKMRPKL
ncbi:uncharacterized protein [Dysidea avara]